jgi:class 3 adenylate cyclase
MTSLPGGTVTLLFTDIEGSTRLIQRLGEEYGRALGEHRRLLRRAVAAHDGSEVECRADEFFAAFHDAGSAVAAVVDAQRAFDGHAWLGGVVFRARMGLNAGELEPEEGNYLGLEVNRAARICSAGHGGQVLLSRSVRQLIGDTHEVRELGEYALAGLPAAEPIYQLVIPGQREDFPPLQAASARAARGRRLRGRRVRQPTLVEQARRLHTVLPEVPKDARGSLTELGASLFTGERAAERADTFLARVDHKRLAARLGDQREMAVRSPHAEREATALQAQATAVARVSDQRRALAESTADVPELLADPAAITSGRASAIHRRVTNATATLDEAVTTAAAHVDPFSYQLKHTRHRGVYRSGGRYLVPFIDTLGADRISDFETLAEARNFRAAVRITEQRGDGSTAPYRSGGEYGGGGGG